MLKLFHVIYVLILAAWFGAIVMIAIAIPTLFWTLPDRELAGDAAAAIFQAFDKTQMILLPALWIGAIGSLVFRQSAGTGGTVVVLGLCGLTLTVGWMLFGVAPEMHALHAEFRNAATDGLAATPRAEFQRLHQRAENLAKINLFLTLGLLIECTWPRNPRESNIAGDAPTSGEPPI